MEDYWWHVIPPNLRTFFQSSENIELYAKNNQDQFYAMVSLSQEIERPLEQVLTVNSVTEISTYCTSIVARTLEGGISHVRNLDFGATALMTKLVYEQVLVRDGLEKATAPSIAGYYGAYTG